MKKSKNLIKVISFFTAFFVALNLLPVNVFTENDAVSISSVNEFKSFMEKCAYDEYSRNKKFVLQNDIDLSGAEIKSAEIFCGVFEGGGHTLKNVSFTSESENKGLFSQLSKDAVIKDLYVTGEVKGSSASTAESLIKKRASSLLKKQDIIDADEENGSTGGIAGYNEGKIINCSFGGKIKGQKNTGGIAGYNAMTGVIDSCLNTAEINADSEVGGIAGYNEGRIKLSKNSGVICADANENTVNGGGICGNNKGALYASTNNGAVGGEKFGDNIGGVCGIQSGEIRECINNGEVKGRRSVGGVCGRFEPYTDIDLSYESARAAIEKQAETLKNDLEDGKSKILDYALDLIDGNGDLSSLLSLLGVSDGADRTKSRLDALSNSATNMMDSIANAADAVSGSDISGTLDSALEELKDTASQTKSDLASFLDDNTDTIRDVSNSLTNTLESVDSTLHEFDGAGEDIDRLTADLRDAIDKGEGDVDEAKDRLKDRLNKLEDNIDEASDNLDETREELQKLIKQTRSEASEMENAFEQIDRTAEDISREMSNIRATINNFIKNIDNSLPQFTFSPILPTDLPSRTLRPITIPTLRPRNSGSYGDYEVETDTDSGTGYEVEIIGKIKDILFPQAYAAEGEEKIAITALKSTDISIPRLIGGENADTALIKYCVNNGTVEGTELSGGIAGSVGFESAVKSGESITLSNGKKVSSDSILKAVTDACINCGNIASSDKYAGGIIGRCDTGSIKNSLSTGEISVEDGDFAGGTAGQSNGEIVNCIAINDVKAKENLGGIAGSAADIKNSYALPRLDGKNANTGAIAGAVSGELLNCYFIDEGLSGINGMNLEGKAEAVKHENMVSSDGTIPQGMKNLSLDDYYMASGDIYLPQIKEIAENKAESIGAILQSKSTELSRFHFAVRFVDKDKELKSMTVDYGTALSDADIPKLTANGTEVPVWDKDTKAPIVRHTVFNAVYNKATTTIATPEEPPLMLAEGVFDDDTAVAVREENEERSFSGYKNGKAYSFTLSSGFYGTIKVHIRDEKTSADKIAIYNDGKWEMADCLLDGSYAVFEAEEPCKFVILYKRPSVILITLICVFIAVLLAAAFVFVRRMKKWKK